MRQVKIKTHGINPNDFNDSAELQNFTNKQIYTKGFEYSTQAGTPNNFPIVLGGKCRKLHGINFFCDINSQTEEDKIGLVINQEQIINDVVWWAYNPQQFSGNVQKGNQFFALPRQLSGQDSVELNVASATSHKIFIVFYLSDI